MLRLKATRRAASRSTFEGFPAFLVTISADPKMER